MTAPAPAPARDAEGKWLPRAEPKKPVARKKAAPVPSAPVVEQCPVDGCGTPATGRRPVPGMVRVRGSKDGALEHWYCPGRCAAIARATADLRRGGAR
ncbi:hypothetical protein [Streptomyces anandii]|uniref:hypothetical protein n=1 Tax=Streptomyces anandii TaxID=285454 RepID=UPI0037B5206B